MKPFGPPPPRQGSSSPTTGGRLALALTIALVLTSAIALAQTPTAKPARTTAAHAPYAGYVRNWHTPDPNKTPPIDANGRPMLALASINTGDRAELAATSDLGGFAARDLDRAAFVLREPSSGNEYPVEPRVLDLAYRIQSHFHAQEIRFISGYRTPRARGGSNHGKGRAIDLIVPGTADADVATFARQLGFVGVGVYPTSGFVHVDVRDRSYFWVDGSAPGKRNRERGILGDLAKSSDREALARGEKQITPLVILRDVDAALRTLAPRSGPATPDAVDEDDDDGT